jgi:GT2 family glycosyltransferase
MELLSMASKAEQLCPTVIASVLNWNQYEMTIACLRSLEGLDYPVTRVFVVDNGSQSFAEDDLRAEFPAVDVIRSERNLGYAGGHRLVVDRMFDQGFDLIWLLNNDLLVAPNALTELVAAYLRHGESLYGGVPLVGDSGDRVPAAIFRETDPAGDPDYRQMIPLRSMAYDEFLHDGTAPRKMAQINGSNMLIPFTVIRRHGFMSETFFLYGEESDYCLRLFRLGIPSYVVPWSLVRHQRSGSTHGHDRLSDMLCYYRARNHHLIAQRYWARRQYRKHLVRDIGKHALELASIVARDPRRAAHSGAYYHCLGVGDAVLGRTGKRFAPEDFLE